MPRVGEPISFLAFTQSMLLEKLNKSFPAFLEILNLHLEDSAKNIINK